MAHAKKGDKIRILQDGLSCAVVRKGDVLEVVGRVGPGVFVTGSADPSDVRTWWFHDHSEGEGWEYVDERRS